MGCDIHLHIEVKIKGFGWHYYGHPHVKRNYELFEKMAGVRGDLEEAIVPPKGLPNDLTFMTLFCWERDRDDAHTPSWLNAQEIAQLSDWWEVGERSKVGFEWDVVSTFTPDGNGWASIHKYPDDNEIEDVRFVFWFDS